MDEAENFFDFVHKCYQKGMTETLIAEKLGISVPQLRWVRHEYLQEERERQKGVSA